MRTKKVCGLILLLVALVSAAPARGAMLPQDVFARAWAVLARVAGLRSISEAKPPDAGRRKGGGCVDPLGHPILCPISDTTTDHTEGGGCVDPLGRPTPCS